MEETVKVTPKRSNRRVAMLIFGIFASVIAVVCGVIFLINYDIAYDQSTYGGWLPPSVSVVIRYILVALGAILLAVILKIIFRKRAYISVLLLTAVLLPILCYQLNYHTLKKGAILYPLMDKGGIFHFLAIRDYNFDGMNDEEHYRLYEEREESFICFCTYEDTRNIIWKIEGSAVGTGAGMNATFCTYDWEQDTFTLHLHADDVTFKQIEIEIFFKDPQMAQTAALYQIEDDREIPIPIADVREQSVTVVFDADACAAFQNNSDNEFVKILFRYDVSG